MLKPPELAAPHQPRSISWKKVPVESGNQAKRSSVQLGGVAGESQSEEQFASFPSSETGVRARESVTRQAPSCAFRLGLCSMHSAQFETGRERIINTLVKGGVAWLHASLRWLLAKMRAHYHSGPQHRRCLTRYESSMQLKNRAPSPSCVTCVGNFASS